MTNKVITLSEKEIEKLANAQSEYDIAKNKLQELKAQYHVTELQPGKYISDEGIVTVSRSYRSTVDNKQIYDDYDVNVEAYTTEKETVTVTIKPLRSKKGLFN